MLGAACVRMRLVMKECTGEYSKMLPDKANPARSYQLLSFRMATGMNTKITRTD